MPAVIRVAASIVAIFSFAPLLGAQPRASNLAMAQALINLAYPELEEGRVEVLVQLTTSLGSNWETAGQLGLSIVRPTRGPIETTTEERTLVAGRLLIDNAAGRVEEAAFTGNYVHVGEMDSLRAALQKLGHWTEADVERELLARGARFPPSQKAVLVEAVNPQRFSGPLHAHLNEMTLGAPPSPLPLPRLPEFGGPEPYWTALFKESEQSCVFLRFEPMEGHFVSLSRTDCTGYK